MRRVCVLAVGFALALTGVALASAAAGTYTGTESQSQSRVPYRISLTVSGNKITRIIYGANYSGHAPCPAYSSSRYVVGAGIKGGKAIAITGNTINARNAKIGPYDVFTYFKGTFTGSTVQGSFDETFTAEAVSGGKVHSYKCTSGKVTFTATSSATS